MTIIVAIPHASRVYFGADSNESNGTLTYPCGEPKIFKRQGLVMGVCGAVRESQLLRYVADLPKPPEAEKDVMPWLCGPFAAAVRDARKQHGFDQKPDGVETGPTLLLGVRGRLFHFDDWQGVTEHHTPWAVGSGQRLALGSLHTSAKLRWAPRRRIEHALRAASDFDDGCAPPFTYERT